MFLPSLKEIEKIIFKLSRRQAFLHKEVLWPWPFIKVIQWSLKRICQTYSAITPNMKSLTNKHFWVRANTIKWHDLLFKVTIWPWPSFKVIKRSLKRNNWYLTSNMFNEKPQCPLSQKVEIWPWVFKNIKPHKNKNIWRIFLKI